MAPFNSIDSLRARSLRSGIKRSFIPGIIAAGANLQYSREHDDIRGVLQDYKEFNSMFILNNSDVAIAIDLDYTPSKRTTIPAHVAIEIPQVSYLEFQITNLSTTAATAAGDIVITAINERPLAREER